jgi:hypothetical protein
VTLRLVAVGRQHLIELLSVGVGIDHFDALLRNTWRIP